MEISLPSLSRPGSDHTVEQTDEGFVIVRRRPEAKAAFDNLARRVIERAGIDYVALPSTDGQAGYDRVFIIPLD